MKLNHSRIAWRFVRTRIIIASVIMSTGFLSPAWAQNGSPVRTAIDQDAARIENAGLKPIAAIEGTFTYQSAKGRLVTPTWRQTFLAAMFKNGGAFEPGHQFSFPKTNRLPDGTIQTMNYLDVSVIGILFADGTTWGTGASLRSMIKDRVAALRSGLREILQVFNTMPFERIESTLQRQGPIIEGQTRSLWLKASLQKRMLDKDGRMYPDALDRAQQLIAEIQTPFED